MRDELRDAEDVRDENANYRQDDGTMAIEGLVGQGRYVVPFTMSREQEAVMMESSRAQLSQLMEECAAPIEEEPSSSWVRVKTKKKPTGVFLWEKRALKAKHELEQHFPREDQDPVVYSVRSSTTVNAPLDTVLKTLDASVATAHRSFTRIIYGSLVADSSVLFHSSAQASDYLDNRESDSFETLAVRWFVCHSSNPMTSDGDFCLQEYTKRHSIDELPMNGEYNNNNTVIGNRNNETNAIEGLHSVQEIPVAYKLFRSLETRHCPELQESHRLVRCKVPLGGILLYPTDSSDKTDVVFYMSIAQDKGANRGNWNGHVSPVHTQCSDRQFRALQQVVRQMAMQIERLNNAAESYQMSLHLESLRASRWVRNAERAECVVCFRRFHQLTRRRHHCRLCGELICRECSVHKDLDLPTFGPTALRICTTCDRTHSQLRPKVLSRSEPEAISSPESPRKRRAKHATRQSKPVKSVGRRRSITLSGYSSSSSSDKQTRKSAGLAAALDSPQFLKAVEQILSCPKPAASPVVNRRYLTNKWSGNRSIAALKSPGISLTAPSTPKLAPSPQGHFHFDPSSSSPHLHSRQRQTQHETQKQIQKYLNADAPNIGIEDEGAFENHIPKSKAGEIRSTSHGYAVKNGVLADANDNQQTAHSSTLDKVRAKQHEQDRSLVHRTVQELKPYEDIFLKLCHDAAAVRHSKFVAFTLFTGAPQGDRNQPNKDDGEEVAAHYLKVKGSVKLIKVADNLRCCDPVLQLQKSVITRNTWEVIGNSALHPSGYEFRQLPVVLGPQQARFYAGVPLVSIKKQYCYGALAVFDAGISPGEDNDPAMTSALLSLEKLAREAVAAVDERRKELELRTFLQAPLLQMRQSEPTLHLKMDLTRRSQHWQDVSDLLSLDGDSDDDQIEEAQRRLEYELHHEKGKSGVAPNSVGKSSVGKPHKVFLTPKSSSVGKARVQYFQNKMQELVQRAQDTQAQMVENPITMERHGVSIV